MHQRDPIPAEAARLLKIYLSGGAIPGNVNPLVLIEMAKQSGEYNPLLKEARAIRALRSRIREHAGRKGLSELPEEEQVRAYISETQLQEEMEQLSWLLESLTPASG